MTCCSTYRKQKLWSKASALSRKINIHQFRASIKERSKANIRYRIPHNLHMSCTRTNKCSTTRNGHLKVISSIVHTIFGRSPWDTIGISLHDNAIGREKNSNVTVATRG